MKSKFCFLSTIFYLKITLTSPSFVNNSYQNVSNHDHRGLMITPSRVQSLEEIVVQGSKHVRAYLGFQMNGNDLNKNSFIMQEMRFTKHMYLSNPG